MINEYHSDLNLYRVFYQVCKSGNFSNAARELNVSQPAISYSIKSLEINIGVNLFVRNSKELKLTPEGEALLPHVEEAINSLKIAEQKINELKNFKKGEIYIGVPSHVGVFFLTDIVEKFYKKYPGIKINIINKRTRELMSLLKNNELDLVIDTSPLGDTKNLDVQKLSTESCCFAYNKNNKDLKKSFNSLKEISGYPLIVPGAETNSTIRLEKIYQRKNIEFEPSFEVGTGGIIAEMVTSGIGIGYLFEKTLYKYKDLEKLNINVELPKFEIYLICKRKMLSRAARKMADYILDSV